MARDDWRIRVQLPPEERRGFLARLGPELSSGARELAKDLEGRRLAVSYDEDGDELFVYAGSRGEAEQARAVIEAELEHAGVDARLSEPEQWLAQEERWSAEPPTEQGDPWTRSVLEHGYAPWEVRVECESREEADALADRLEAEGYGVVRRAHYVLAGTATEEEARELAARLHGEVEAGGELVYEVVPQNPFAIFGGLGGTGTPI